MDYRTSARPAEIIKPALQYTFIEKLIDSDKLLHNGFAFLLVAFKRSYIALACIALGSFAVFLFGLFAYLNFRLCFHFTSQWGSTPSDSTAFAVLLSIVPMALEGYALHLVIDNVRDEINSTRLGLRDKRRKYKELEE